MTGFGVARAKSRPPTGPPPNPEMEYQLGYGSPRTVTGSTTSLQPASFSGQTADGKYDFISQALQVTVGMHF